ncbi:MAG: pyridoxal-phosphate dependent enzyme [bacterium]|nr:pyridoxal-phosphate dependent enzyme [bacterium]
MSDLYIQSPLIESIHLRQAAGGKIWLKMDALQPCGSFKARGIGFACRHYAAQGATSLVSSSGGNAGLAVAYAGRVLGIAATVVVPVTTRPRVIALIKREGAEVVVTGENWDGAHAYAMALSQKEGAVYIHPFDDPLIWAGHASVIDEIREAGVIPDAVVLSVGGGGLLCGVVEGLRRNNWHGVGVLAVETEGADSLSVASRANEHIGIDRIDSLATSLGAKKVAKRAFDLLDDYPVVSHVVTDRQAVDACYRFLDDHRVLVEPACGASLSAVYDGCAFLADKHCVVVIVCGGVGVTLGQLAAWREQVS